VNYPELRAKLAVGDSLTEVLLEQSMTHRSYSYENGAVPTNERLEFLGDAVLGLVITDHLYRTFPDRPEGQLAKLRSAVVNSRALAQVGRDLGLGDYIRLGRGEETTGGRDKSSILADTLEAVIGAVHIDCGPPVVIELIHRLFDDLVETSARLGAGLDWKTSMQELVSQRGLGTPEYVIGQEGPDHEKTFTARVRVGGELLGFGSGRSKKEAEQGAAETAYAELTADTAKS